MAVAWVKTGREAFLEEEDDFFRRNALLIIKEMVEMNNPPSVHTSMLMDEVLHAIFFLGKIHNPPYSPENLVNEEHLSLLRSSYSQPFELFSSHLPRRSPFSCVLDMIVHVTGEKNENEIMTKLQKLIGELAEGEAKDLISSTICVSQNTSTKDSVRHYGVSVSISGRRFRQIIIGAACLSNWDSYVSDAVMTYYPEKGERMERKKTYFDGTIKLPLQVRCEAYNLIKGGTKDPCQLCGNLFGLPNASDEKGMWPYGNCAEAESISNLLKNEIEVREQVQQTSVTCTDVNRTRAINSVLEVLRMNIGFRWDGKYYSPMTPKTRKRQAVVRKK